MKNTVSVSNLPKHEENPFLEMALHQVEENRVRKTQYIRGTKGVENILAMGNTGEVIGHTRFVRYIEVDETKFAKVYLSQFAAFWELSKTAIRVFGYIINNLVPNKDIVYIDLQEVLKYTKYKEEKSVYKGIAELVNAEIIARSTNHVKYFINPLIFFNGDRVTYATTYVKKRASKQVNGNDPNQLSVFNSGIDPNAAFDHFLNPANRTETIALSSIAIFLSFSMACLNQLFA